MIEEMLSPGEKLYVRRRRGQESTGMAARRMVVCIKLYRHWEKDVPGTNPPNIDLGGLKPWEHYIVMRKRIGLSSMEVSRRMGVSQSTVLNMERGEGSLKRYREFFGQ